MMFLGSMLTVFGIGFVCWLLFTLAIYALPFFAGLTAGLAAIHSGAGVVGAIIVAVLTGGATLVLGQMAFAMVRSPLVRAAIGLAYAVPATVAGYHATLGLATIGVPSETWRAAFAMVGAVVIGGTAWARMSLLTSLGVGQGMAGGSSDGSLTTATSGAAPARLHPRTG